MDGLKSIVLANIYYSLLTCFIFTWLTHQPFYCPFMKKLSTKGNLSFGNSTQFLELSKYYYFSKLMKEQCRGARELALFWYCSCWNYCFYLSLGSCSYCVVFCFTVFHLGYKVTLYLLVSQVNIAPGHMSGSY